MQCDPLPYNRGVAPLGAAADRPPAAWTHDGACLDGIDHGLLLYRASRLEALVDPLEHLLSTQPPAGLLAPQTVIAAHAGMRHWLAGALARRRGPGGIVANLDIVLPSTWLDRLARDVLGESAVALAPYQRAGLRWRIHDLLPSLDVPLLHAYLAGPGDGERRRFQLADRLARLYGQYLVYRPDWLRDWARGRPAVPGDDLLRPLWERLRAGIGVAHRAELLTQLVGVLGRSRAPGADEPLHVFGTSHLAPAEMAVLRAMARQRPVVLYVPDPCREYWLGLRDERALLRQLTRDDPDGERTEGLFLDQPHPLLAAWGRMGQHFMLALEDSDVAVDERHWQDRGDSVVPVTRLARLQEGIRRLQPGLVAEPADRATALADRSLRIHACHTPLRELEVLRDALLRELRDQPGLRPADIVVMAPDIQAYVPLLAAVFGPPGEGGGPLPYHLADVAIAGAHPLLQAFDRLLDLPAARLTANEVLDLLAVPDVARRLGLGPGDLELLVAWLRESRVAWSLDAAFRARFGVPAVAEHGFAWGVDRLFAGYVMGTAADGEVRAVELPDGPLAPLAGAAGPQADALGALDALLGALAAYYDAAHSVLPASDWALRLDALLEALFRVDPFDAAARDALALLRGLVRRLAEEPAAAGLDPALSFGVVRDWLRDALSAAPERQRFLMGGVTVCGMVPQRAIPFRVVAVLGLCDGDFPRTANAGGLDLMPLHRRRGDRDVRSDDRYLFLETVMSARDTLHLSYVGEGVRDGKPRNPAAPLAELMALLAAWPGADAAPATGIEGAPAPGPAGPAWSVRHPLQPFDARYFDGSDPRLFSFRPDFAAMHARPPVPPPRFIGAAPGTQASGPAAADTNTDTDTGPAVVAASAAARLPVPLLALTGYFRDPARHLLRDGLRLRLDALDAERLPSDEPLDARPDRRDGSLARLLLDAATAGTGVPAEAPAWLRLTGLLPAGRVGDRAWEDLRSAAERMLGRLASQPLFAGPLPAASPAPVAVAVGGWQVEGSVQRLFERDGTRWLLALHLNARDDALGFRELLGVLLEWSLLRLHAPDDPRPLRVLLVTAGDGSAWQDRFNAWDAAYVAALDRGDGAALATLRADLARRVDGLVSFWAASRVHPRWYFPKTSWAAVEEGAHGIETAWRGDGQGFANGERGHAPGYAQLLAGDREFADGGPDHVALLEAARELRALLELPPVDAPDAASAPGGME